MTYTHISYQNGDEFLLDHNAQDNGQTCRGDIVAMKIDDQWSRADRLSFTRVLLQTGNDVDGEGVHTVEEVIGQSIDSLPDARVVPEFYGFDYVVGHLPQVTRFSQIDRGVTEDEDMNISDVVFAYDSLSGASNVSGTIVAAKNSLGWVIMDPDATGAYQAKNITCKLEPVIGHDVYTAVESLDNCSLSLSDMENLTDNELQM